MPYREGGNHPIYDDGYHRFRISTFRRDRGSPYVDFHAEL